MDIEDHEFQAFNGGCDSLREHKVRDIIYECFEGVDGAASRLLARYGYSLFGLRGSVFGPVLLERLDAGRRPYGDHNLVATIDPERLRRRMSAKWYRCLSRGARAGAHARVPPKR